MRFYGYATISHAITRFYVSHCTDLVLEIMIINNILIQR